MFKVGMRVRKVAFWSVPLTASESVPLGAEGVIERYDAGAAGSVPWRVRYDQHGVAWASDHMLAPLTNPDSEWADEAVKSLIRKATTDKLPLAAEMLTEIRGGA